MFSDGVIAILITIMVLELGKPDEPTWKGLSHVAPHFGWYLLSFMNLGSYWNSHHHLFMTIDRISGSVLWANLNLLFWLSLVPFATAWAGESSLAPVPTAVYGLIQLLSGISIYILIRRLMVANGPRSRVSQALARDRKGKVSVGILIVATPLALVWPRAAVVLYVIVALMWMVPDRRMERA